MAVYHLGELHNHKERKGGKVGGDWSSVGHFIGVGNHIGAYIKFP